MPFKTTCRSLLRSVLVLMTLCGVAMALSSCGGNVKKGIENDIGAPQLTAVAQEYRIGVGDQLQIDVWRNEDLSGTVTVRPDGKITAPFVGTVVAAGLTTEELASNISESLSEFLKIAKVTVTVANSGSTDFQRRVRISGAVNSQLSIPFRDGMTVLDLVLEAGGPNDFAKLRKAKLHRKTSNGPQVYDINLDDLLNKGKADSNYPLQPSDHITVPERRI